MRIRKYLLTINITMGHYITLYKWAAAKSISMSELARQLIEGLGEAPDSGLNETELEIMERYKRCVGEDIPGGGMPRRRLPATLERLDGPPPAKQAEIKLMTAEDTIKLIEALPPDHKERQYLPQLRREVNEYRAFLGLPLVEFNTQTPDDLKPI